MKRTNKSTAIDRLSLKELLSFLFLLWECCVWWFSLISSIEPISEKKSENGWIELGQNHIRLIKFMREKDKKKTTNNLQQSNTNTK